MQIVKISEPNSRDIEDNEIVVGIDFGTTNSLISISKNYNAEAIKIDGGSELLPSIINIENDKIIVGQKASDKNYIRSIKRLFAKSSTDIIDNPNLYNLSDILILDNDIPKINKFGFEVSLPEMGAEIFKHLKMQGEKFLGITLKKAVVSVPAYFDDSARGQVLLAAKLAGLEVVRLIAEPTAAAYAYGLNNKTEGSYLVYDLGGGTFDVSVLNMHNGVLQVIATGGDNMLGGDDIDMLVANYLADNLKCNINSTLISEAKILKEELSLKPEVSFNGVIISREKYENIISSIIQKTIKITKDTLYEAQEIEDFELSGIILVGGSTKSPLIISKLKEAFSLPIYSDLDPDKIVAFGAAMQAENLTSKSNSLLIDIVPLSVGLEMYGGIVEKLILRNTPIPFSITKEFTTHANNQTGIKLHIVQGEREMVRDCRSLAYFELNDIPPMKAGKAKIQVTFAIDANGILSVTAAQIETGKVHNIEIKPSYGLSGDEINKALNDAFKNAANDHAERLLLEARSDADNLINGLKIAISETPDLLSKNEQFELDNAINSLQLVINLDNRENILLEMTKLNKIAENFIQKHLDKGANQHLKGIHVDKIMK